MGNILYFVAFVLMVVWAIATAGFHAGGVIHLLIVLAVISVLVRFVLERQPR